VGEDEGSLCLRETEVHKFTVESQSTRNNLARARDKCQKKLEILHNPHLSLFRFQGDGSRIGSIRNRVDPLNSCSTNELRDVLRLRVPGDSDRLWARHLMLDFRNARRGP
jgi:hypothetical protein